MTGTTHSGSVIEHVLGLFGLFLLGLTGWAADRLQGKARPAALFARVVLAWVMTVGWAIDRLPFRTNGRSRSNGSALAPSVSLRVQGNGR